MPIAKTSRRTLPRTLGRCLLAVLAVTVVGGMVVTLSSHRAAFLHAIAGVPASTLIGVVVLHVGTVVARSEAWAVSVRSAGCTLPRRDAFQVASLGFAANVVSCSLGAAVRISALRTKAPDRAPSASALVAAEVPVLAIQALASAVMSVSLIGPLGVPWWVPLLALAGAAGGFAVLGRVAARRADGPLSGLAALRSGRARARIAACLIIVAAFETTRNLIVLRAVGLDAGPLDAMALLVGTGLLATLPIGPGSGAGAAMLMFGAGGVGPAAAAGVLLTATALTANLVYAGWGSGDMLWRSCPVRLGRLPRAVDFAAMCFAGGAATAVALA